MTNVNNWFQALENANKDTPHIVVGYGSLLSKQSRVRFSNIRSLPLPCVVKGWERAWVTRSIEEKQTYVGAYRNSTSEFNGQAFFTNIDAQLQRREQDYRFSELELANLDFYFPLNESQLNMLASVTIYVCETLEQQAPTSEFPVNDSYIDTCLTGCMEVGGAEEVEAFVKNTRHWPYSFKRNDRLQPNYPRAASGSASEWVMFDEIQNRRQEY